MIKYTLIVELKDGTTMITEYFDVALALAEMQTYIAAGNMFALKTERV